MNYISTPLSYDDNSGLKLKRTLASETAQLDSLIELIVFTPRGSFLADPEFGFEYWNYEFANIQYRPFNSGQIGVSSGKAYQEITKIECQESIRQSLLTYAPQLKNVNIFIELNAALNEKQRKKKVQSKHVVNIVVEGNIENGIATNHYKKEIVFLMEPTAKKYVQY